MPNRLSYKNILICTFRSSLIISSNEIEYLRLEPVWIGSIINFHVLTNGYLNLISVPDLAYISSGPNYGVVVVLKWSTTGSSDFSEFGVSFRIGLGLVAYWDIETGGIWEIWAGEKII